MLITLSEDVGGYFYDVFIAKFDLWLALGIFGQLMFAMRFIVQWLASEKEGRSVIPLAFWFFSIGGGAITLVYGLYKREPVIIIGQSLCAVHLCAQPHAHRPREADQGARPEARLRRRP